MNFEVVKATMEGLKARLVGLEHKAAAIFTEAEQGPVAELHKEYREIMDDIHAHLGTLHDFAASIEGRLRQVEDKVGLGDKIAKTGVDEKPAVAAPAAPAAPAVGEHKSESAAPAPTGGTETVKAP